MDLNACALLSVFILCRADRVPPSCGSRMCEMLCNNYLSPCYITQDLICSVSGTRVQRSFTAKVINGVNSKTSRVIACQTTPETWNHRLKCIEETSFLPQTFSENIKTVTPTPVTSKQTKESSSSIEHFATDTPTSVTSKQTKESSSSTEHFATDTPTSVTSKQTKESSSSTEHFATDTPTSVTSKRTKESSSSSTEHFATDTPTSVTSKQAIAPTSTEHFIIDTPTSVTSKQATSPTSVEYFITDTPTTVTSKQTTAPTSAEYFIKDTQTTVTSKQTTLPTPAERFTIDISKSVTSVQTSVFRTYTRNLVPSNNAHTSSKKTHDVKRERRSRYLAILTTNSLYFLKMPTYKVSFKKRAKTVSDILYNEHNNRLYWLSRRHPPAVGYFTGRSCQLKTVLDMLTGHIQNFGFDTSTLYIAYTTSKMGQPFLYRVRNNGVNKPQCIARLPSLYGPMVVNVKLSTVYVYHGRQKMLSEITTGGERKRSLQTTDKYRPLITTDNKDMIYLPFRSGKIFRLRIGAWKSEQIKVKIPDNFKMMAVRHDRIILLGKSQMYVYNNKWKFEKEKRFGQGVIMIAFALLG